MTNCPNINERGRLLGTKEYYSLLTRYLLVLFMMGTWIGFQVKKFMEASVHWTFCFVFSSFFSVISYQLGFLLYFVIGFWKKTSGYFFFD